MHLLMRKVKIKVAIAFMYGKGVKTPANAYREVRSEKSPMVVEKYE